MSKTPKAERIPGPGAGKSKLALAFLCVYWPVIFVASHVPKEMVPKGWTVSGAGLHVLAYSVLTVLVFATAGMLRRTALRCRKTWALVALISGYAAVDELLQLTSPGRDGRVMDWLVDTMACLLCVGLLALLAKFSECRSRT